MEPMDFKIYKDLYSYPQAFARHFVPPNTTHPPLL